jgi:hypothetical protein
MLIRRLSVLLGMALLLGLLFSEDVVWKTIVSWTVGATAFLGHSFIVVLLQSLLLTLGPAYLVLRVSDAWFEVPEESDDVLVLGAVSLASMFGGWLPLPSFLSGVVLIGLRCAVVVYLVRVLIKMSAFQQVDSVEPNSPFKRIGVGLFLLVLFLVPALAQASGYSFRKFASLLHVPRSLLELVAAVGFTIALFTLTKLRNRIVDPTIGRGLLTAGTVLYVSATLVGGVFLAYVASLFGVSEQSAGLILAPLLVIAVVATPILFLTKWLLLFGAVRLLTNLSPDPSPLGAPVQAP